MTAARTTRVAAPKPKSASEKTIKPGLVCTFYSYKGGVGRSMALANVAIMALPVGDNGCLLIDWDLEAPGLERFFGMRLHGSRANQPGLIDLINSYDVENSATDGAPVDWRECRLKVSVPQGETIDIIHAGREGETYTSQLRALNWDRLFAQGFGRQLEDLRDEWRAQYDYVLVDSRTGITDIGGICSILLPDYLVSLFTTTEQSVLGVKDTMVRARTAQKELPLDRQRRSSSRLRRATKATRNTKGPPNGESASRANSRVSMTIGSTRTKPPKACSTTSRYLTSRFGVSARACPSSRRIQATRRPLPIPMH